MSIVLDGTTGLAGAATGALNGALGATTPSTVAATTVVASSTIKGATTIGVGAATPSASGAGITFPATQSASTDANTLDDYEEGTWVPSQGAGLTVIGTFSSGGTYTKIGRLVNVSGFVKGSTSVAVATAATVIAGNLPFTVLAGTTAYYMGNATNNDANVNIGILAFQNTTNIISVQTIAATPGIYFSCTYTV
jgi:hypothetical protein